MRLIRIKMTILKTPSSTYELDSLFTATNRWEILNQQQWKVLCSIKRFINYCKVYREGFLNVFSKFTPDVRHCVNNVILKSMGGGGGGGGKGGSNPVEASDFFSGLSLQLLHN